MENLEDGYSYLMENYSKGDDIFLFGFSRGAFTARTLAGIISCFGILERGNKNLIPYVMKMYTEKYYETKKDVVEGFAQDFCNTPDIHCLAVWDTVASLGHFFGKQFPNRLLSPKVKNAFHAMAIDEKRKKFLVSIWEEDGLNADQHVEQVWFPGVHSDVGGSYPERQLSDIAMAWMMDKVSDPKVRLRMNDGWQDKLSQDPVGTMHDSWDDWKWRFWKPVDRPIPPGAIVHKSVQDRIDAGIGYEPPNLPDQSDYSVQTPNPSLYR